MEEQAYGDSNHQRLTQAIIFLQMLNETPEEPSENPLDRFSAQAGSFSSGRVLKPKQEKLLVEALAFLASSSDDPSKVMALCIEEGQEPPSLIIRVAVNRGGTANVTEGFERMARVLENTAIQGLLSLALNF